MGKPAGLTPFLIVITSSSVEDTVWDAVQEAVDAGWDARRFRAEVRSAWAEARRNQAKDDDLVLREAAQ